MGSIYRFFAKSIENVLDDLQFLEKINLINKKFRIIIEPIKNARLGDFSSNIAMMYGKSLGLNPCDFGEQIVSKLKTQDFVLQASVESPGFINWKCKEDFLINFFKTSIEEQNYGFVNIGEGKRVNVEYVSANPTGPLHCGHVRGAVLGDALASLLTKVGYEVTKEYYINDYGNQVDMLVKSLYERYKELLGEDTFKDSMMYPGEYIIDIAKTVLAKYGDSLKNISEAERYTILKNAAITDIMYNIKQDLLLLGIEHDVFTSETSLVERGKVQNTIDALTNKGYIYKGVLVPPKGKVIEDWEPSEQTLFRTVDFGDDVDRPLVKNNGSWTYYASDIAYHKDKIERKYDILVDLFGADHGGYVNRMRAAVKALSDDVEFKILLCQLVKFSDGGKEVKMSKRAGNFVTLRDVVEAVGKDVIRFIMLTRKSEAPFTFDYQEVISQSQNNPVFYVQYAYARTYSVMRQLKKIYPELTIDDLADDLQIQFISTKIEIDIIKYMLDWPRQIEIAARGYEPHKIAFYLLELAALFHNWWNAGKDNEKLRFISDNIAVTKAKIWLVLAVQKVLKSGLELIGLSLKEEL